MHRQSESFGLRKRNEFPSRNGGKGKVKDTCIGSRIALDFRCLVALGAAMVENERTKGSDAKLNNQPTKANTSEKNTKTKADYLSATAGGISK